MERLLVVLHQQVNPERVAGALESWSAELIWSHIGVEPVTLRRLTPLEYYV